MNFRPAIKFCSQCGSATEQAIPSDGDTRLRAICTGCGMVHYQNPLNVVGCIPVTDDGRILLCKRNIEPRWGKWTLPAGFMELDETTSQGAARETDEEAGADIEMGRLFSVISVPRVAQVHLFYCARLRSEILNPGYETIEARLFQPADIPWDELAFRTVSVTLQRFLEDRAAGSIQVHNIDLT
ncbi:MAG: NUDIX hydrolase [Comamonas sp.]|jgi:ADP-ribose pyrophosphatase YjhB (NUDIX family)|nr:NUDIX hydrolase [uncultured Comamonas sp.]